MLCEKPVVDETCTLLTVESQLYPECVVTRAMAKKAEMESHSDVTDVQGDTDCDMTFSESKTLLPQTQKQTLLLHRVCYQNR